MKAILKDNRDVVVDVKCIGGTSTMLVYRDVESGDIYYDFQLEFIDYYGG